jgi:DNA invertase Pin-like site-specific DNA recombinase
MSSKRNPDKGPKLNAAQARQIRELFADGESVLDLARRFSVSDQAIKDVLNFETWGSAGGPRKSVER